MRDAIKRQILALEAASPEDELACQVDLDRYGVCAIDQDGRRVDLQGIRNGLSIDRVHFDEVDGS